MKIAVLDNDLLVRDNHNFPNLAVMKLSGYHKQMGDSVEMATFDDINPMALFKKEYDRIYISKAFTETYTPDWVYKLDNVKLGGTGFYFDKAEPLNLEIEHSMPDYNAYQDVYHIIKDTMFYTDYSIGYTTRGCFRHCDFCVNRNSSKVNIHSPIDEFYDSSKKKFALLDDNILGLPNKYLFKIFDRFEEIGKPIQYRQGMDIRLLSEERIERLLRLKYDGGKGGFTYYFSFDLWQYKDIIEQKLKLFSEMYFMKKPDVKWIRTKLYCFCGFNPTNEKSESHWINDLEILFKRIGIIFKYKAAPFIMKHKDYKDSPFSYVYDEAANWANGINGTALQMSFNEYLDTAYKNTLKTRQFRDKYPQFKKLFGFSLNGY